MLKQVEKAKQDDAFSDLSNLLDELKDMAVDMGSEIERLAALTSLHEHLLLQILSWKCFLFCIDFILETLY